MDRAAIIGTGLIGGSVGLGLREGGWFVTGWDPSSEALAAAYQVGALDEQAPGLDEALTGADLVVLAGPPRAIAALVADLDTEALVIDVAGAKERVAAANRLPRFVGTHPMAGREHGGASHASPGLFVGATWVVIDEGVQPSDLAIVERLIGQLGAEPVRMSAEAHDRAVAAVSHLPQVLAAGLVADIESVPGAQRLASGSFRDLTRVALSEPRLWVDVLMANRDEVVGALAKLSSTIDRWRAALEDADEGFLEEELAGAREIRRHMAPAVVSVGVYLEDRPGELAAVGRALARSRVDVRDLQLRHGPHGGGGVLTLSVHPGEAGALRTALLAEDFELDS